MKKGTVTKNFANVKTMDGSASLGLAMQIGDYVYGDLSTANTDIINFTHFYRRDGTKVELGKPNKASIANMSVTNETEPATIPPIPDPVSVPSIPVKVHQIDVYSDGSLVIDGIPYQ